MAIDLGMLPDVFFVGYVDDSDLPRYCPASDFLVLPSKDRSEGFGWGEMLGGLLRSMTGLLWLLRLSRYINES